MFKFVTIFLIGLSLCQGDPRCPFQSCQSTYNSDNGCTITCTNQSIPEPGNQHEKIYNIHFMNLKQIRKNAFVNLEIETMRINAKSLSRVDNDAFNGIDALNSLYLDSINDYKLFFEHDELEPLKNLTSMLSIDRCNLNNETVIDVLEKVENWKRLKSLSLSNNYFPAFEYDFNVNFPSLTDLYLSSNQIENLDIASDKIINLGLSGNKLIELKTQDFDLVPNLQYLDVNSNMIEKFVFHPKSELRTLQMNSNKIKKLSNQSFINVTKLNSLYLNNNLITEIEEGTFCELENLEKLSLSGNMIGHERLYCLNKLTSLYMSKTNLTGEVTQEELGDSDKLQYLDLSNNKIESIQFESMKQLNRLYLSQNCLKNISDQTLYSMSNLVYLDISNNDFEHLGHSEFKHLKNLKELYIRSNDLKKLMTQDLEYVYSLDKLDLGYNKLEKVQFPDLDSLVYLDLTYNKLTEIKKTTFMNLKNLKQLILSNNMIQKIEAKSFDKNQRLESLILNNNFLTTTPDISKLSVLDTLNLENNRIYFLGNNAFERDLNEVNMMKTRIKIDLNGNNITKFSSKTFCSQYTYSLGFEGFEIQLDQVNHMPTCLLGQLESDDTKIYSKQKYPCNIKMASKYFNITLIDNQSDCLNVTNDHEKCENETIYKCPKSHEMVRFTSWITGDPHVYSYKTKYELCTLGEEAVCFQNENFTLLCSDKHVGKSNKSATVLTKVEFIYNLPDGSNVTFMANETHFPDMFSNNNQKIFENVNGSMNIYVELVNYYNETKIIFINESKTHIFISRYKTYYSITMRATHETYTESSGVLYEGCHTEMKKEMKRRKRSTTCSSECAKVNVTIDDEDVPEDILEEACNYDCEEIGIEAVGFIKNTIGLMELVNRSDTERIEQPLIFATTSRPGDLISASNRILASFYFLFAILFFRIF